MLVWAQSEPLPTDETVRIGKLKNGLTYYLRHNAKDAGLADFYIAQRVGSILEEPRQRGLAHFLEHMAFNGTKHFSGKGKNLGIVPWCETIGVKFGANLNAYTSVDQTVYHIGAVPLKRDGIIDSCLLILNDWSHFLLLEDEEIDKERGVIHEEWRNRRSGMALQRMMEQTMPIVYKGSKYEDCLPIGSMEIVDNFPYNDLRDYYHKWYRPDLQGIVIVGDFDVDKMEKKIKKLFSKIPMPRNAAERIYYPVPDNNEVIVAIERDKEQPIVLADIYMKRNVVPDADKNNKNYLRQNYINNLIQYMLNGRLAELRQQANPPYMSATSHNGTFFLSRTKAAFSLSISCKHNNVLGGIISAVAITEQARQHGFTETELKRAKDIYLTAARRRFDERDQMHNSHYVNKCVNNFLTNEPLLSAQFEYENTQQLTSDVTLAEVNKVVKQLITNQNQVIILYGPDKEEIKLPTEEMLKQIVLTTQQQKYAPYTEADIPTELISNKPKAGQIISEKTVAHGFTEFILSNGMKVYAKQTNNTTDGLQMLIKGEGGTSLYTDTDIPNFSLINSAISEAGLGNFDATTLRKMLAGKAVKVSSSVGSKVQSISASGSVKEMKTLFELSYLYFTQPRYDTIAFEGLMNRTRSFLANRNASPKVAYNDSIMAALYGNNPRTAPVTLSVIEKASYNRIFEIYKNSFADAANFTAVIIGNVSADALRPMICQYLASLPATHQMQKTNTNNIPQIVDGKHIHKFVKAQATPIANVSIYLTATTPFSAQSDLVLDFLSRTLQIAYTDSVREEKGGTYGVGVDFELENDSSNNAMLKISYKCDPQRYSELNAIIYRQLSNMATFGPNEKNLEKVKQYLTKQYAQLQIEDDYWNYIIWHQIEDEVDFDKDYLQMVKQITANDVQQMAKLLLDANRCIEVTMLSE